MTIEIIKTPKGTLSSALSLAVVQHVTDYGPCDLADIAQALKAVDGYNHKVEIGLPTRLRDLCRANHLHRVLINDHLHWKVGPDEEEEEEEAVPAVRTAAPPRRNNVMAGHYIPERAPVVRPGADHRHLQSRGHRC